ncbi:cell wall synthase accessory phosphoprotein MacP [Streptococcus sanguinis]|uniref:cell wall synthase accessory phosphoprotein MacP n=1 Tax=Streptococcus sanguinis TaxID=1305 RepID=UPI001CBF222D|nr:cell wall synthase accessory phosphoprotein MacP [Streptococcus sanguinis]MBZ2037885.1 cell wall synthase accessory phosphoprotein MacP [Streptococcus sanguinis]MBZ2067447.1 cell wall synthase accessory phosphoprotein MacP [Streptococcus sanguinis]MBZ2070433.1 cell wall synthase accessory phosphoprotein MacP [Streptococcus sanguinis]
MGKALLTDEIIERANRGEDISGPPLMDDEETKILSTGRSSFSSQQSSRQDTQFGYQSPQNRFGYEEARSQKYQSQFGHQTAQNQEEFTDETLHIEVDPTVTKSRRIENQKRSLFQAKLNKILLWVVILLIGLIAAIIWWP